MGRKGAYAACEASAKPVKPSCHDAPIAWLRSRIRLRACRRATRGSRSFSHGLVRKQQGASCVCWQGQGESSCLVPGFWELFGELNELSVSYLSLLLITHSHHLFDNLLRLTSSHRISENYPLIYNLA